jgi:hypothetical protein
MAKAAATDQKEPTFDILDNIDLTNFDEIAAFQKGGKVEDEKGDDDEDLDDEEDDGAEGAGAGKGGQQKAGAAQRKAVATDKPTEIEISDELLIEGLQKASGKEVTKKKDPPAAGGKTAGVAAAKADTKKDDAEEVDNPNPDSPFSVHYDLMVESGEWEPIEGFDGTKASYLKAKEFNNNRDIEDGINAFIEDAFKNNPEGAVAGRKLLNHLAHGGKVSDFVMLQAPQEIDFEALEDKDEKVAAAAALDILPRYYQSIGWSKKDIDKKLALLEKTGGEIDEAKLIADPFKNMIKAREQAASATLQKQKQAETHSRNTINASLIQGIEKSKDFGLFKIGTTKKEKDEIKSYMFVETEAGQGSSFSQDLNAALRDPNFLLFTANVLKNKLHEADPKTFKKKDGEGDATDALEERLSKSLLNKKLSDKTADTNFSGRTAARGDSKLEFNLDEAVVINN